MVMPPEFGHVFLTSGSLTAEPRLRVGVATVNNWFTRIVENEPVREIGHIVP
jgi:hypothetical protein